MTGLLYISVSYGSLIQEFLMRYLSIRKRTVGFNAIKNMNIRYSLRILMDIAKIEATMKLNPRSILANVCPKVTNPLSADEAHFRVRYVAG